MPVVGVTAEEEAVLRSLYRRDVAHWSWSHWLNLYRKFGEAVMGFQWVILPYGGKDVELPVMRRRMNEIYYECIADYARDTYELGIRLDKATKKLILCPLADP